MSNSTGMRRTTCGCLKVSHQDTDADVGFPADETLLILEAPDSSALKKSSGIAHITAAAVWMAPASFCSLQSLISLHFLNCLHGYSLHKMIKHLIIIIQIRA